jgi:phosphoribosylglycinamide formyltransferase-1
LTGTAAQSSRPAVILISGRGSNMQVIAEAALAGRLAIDVRAVLSDRADAAGIATARALGIETRVVAPRPGLERSQYDRELAAAVRGYAPQIVVLAGFMRILSAPFVEEFLGRTLNIHPSLLPKYRGLHTHRRVLEAHEREHGASVHFVTPELDGGPVVIQGRLKVRPGDDEKSLAARVQKLEHRIYPQAIAWLAEGRLRWNAGQLQLDGRPLAAPRIIDDEDA